MSRDYFQVRATIYMTPEEQRQLRADQLLAEGDSTRATLAAVVQADLDGLGLGHGWWHEVSVH